MLALVPRVVDALFAAVEPQLPVREEPVHPLGCHRRRISDRDVFEAIVFRLVTGCSWDVAGRLGRGGETTLRTRYNAWNADGVTETEATATDSLRDCRSILPQYIAFSSCFMPWCCYRYRPDHLDQHSMVDSESEPPLESLR